MADRIAKALLYVARTDDDEEWRRVNAMRLPAEAEIVELIVKGSSGKPNRSISGNVSK